MIQSKAGPDEGHQRHCPLPGDCQGDEEKREFVVGVESFAFRERSYETNEGGCEFIHYALVTHHNHSFGVIYYAHLMSIMLLI